MTDAPSVPDPTKAGSKHPKRGRLKVFLGMSPGVGKTYEMLRAARRRKAEGGDVAVAAKVWLYAGLGGGAAGVACRFQDHRRFYAFLLNGHNGWMIARATPEKLQPLATGKLAGKQIMPGLAEARVEARCNGDQLEMHVNGRKVGSVRDDAYATGISGLMLAAEKAAGANAKFDDFALDRL